MEILICHSCGVILRSLTRPCRVCGSSVSIHSSNSVEHLFETKGSALAITMRPNSHLAELALNRFYPTPARLSSSEPPETGSTGSQSSKEEHPDEKPEKPVQKTGPSFDPESIKQLSDLLTTELNRKADGATASGLPAAENSYSESEKNERAGSRAEAEQNQDSQLKAYLAPVEALTRSPEYEDTALVASLADKLKLSNDEENNAPCPEDALSASPDESLPKTEAGANSLQESEVDNHLKEENYAKDESSKSEKQSEEPLKETESQKEEADNEIPSSQDSSAVCSESSTAADSHAGAELIDKNSQGNEAEDAQTETEIEPFYVSKAVARADRNNKIKVEKKKQISGVRNNSIVAEAEKEARVEKDSEKTNEVLFRIAAYPVSREHLIGASVLAFVILFSLAMLSSILVGIVSVSSKISESQKQANGNSNGLPFQTLESTGAERSSQSDHSLSAETPGASNLQQAPYNAEEGDPKKPNEYSVQDSAKSYNAQIQPGTAVEREETYPSTVNGYWDFRYENSPGKIGQGKMLLHQSGSLIQGEGSDSNGDFKIGGVLEHSTISFKKTYYKNGKAAGKPLDYEAKILLVSSEKSKAFLAMSGAWHIRKNVNRGNRSQPVDFKGNFEARLIESTEMK